MTIRKAWAVFGSLLIALYIGGFFFIPPLIYATTFSVARDIPLLIHDVLYAPLLKSSPDDGWLRKVWWSNANYWCGKSDGCVKAHDSEAKAEK